MGSALTVAVVPRAMKFGVTFLDDGRERGGSLSELWSVRFERVSPVREFPTFRGQRNFPGSWWSATTGGHVGYESWLERDQVMLLDFDPGVVSVASQPFWLSWSAAGGTRRHAPDFFARLSDGTGVVIDVRADDRIKPDDAEVFMVTAEACESVGWAYRRVGVVDAVLAANVRWLAGYRHRRCFHPDRAAQLRAVFASPRMLSEGIAAAGERLAFLPVLFHLLWTGVLVCDLAMSPLGSASMLTAAEPPG
jgi:hypothetical protein